MSAFTLTSPPDEGVEPPRTKSGKRKPQPNGYAAKPGTGPEGLTCKTCAHAYSRCGGSKNYWKCDLVKPTGGMGTDIRLKSPACRFYAIEERTRGRAGSGAVSARRTRREWTRH